MSLEDDFQDFLAREEPRPEDVFTMVTFLPHMKKRITCHLEDESGEKILTSEVAESLVQYVDAQLKMKDEPNDINSKIFPLAAQFIVSIVPRFIGIQNASILITSSVFRDALTTLSVSSMLLMQYINQHNLKIITETTDVSEEEIAIWRERSADYDDRIERALYSAFHEEDG